MSTLKSHQPNSLRTARRPAPAGDAGHAPRAEAQPSRGSFASSATLGLGLAGSALWWAALPPANLWPLAWIAPAPWLILVRRESMPGKRPYAALFLAGFCYWMATLHWLRLPHPATSIGWVALSLYLGIYLPVFVGLARVAVHQLRCPLIVAAPVVWTGLELAQSHLLTGFNMASLGHTQYRWIALIQLCDLWGAYGVSFLVMLVAACLASAIPLDGQELSGRRSLRPRSLGFVALAVAAVGVALFYGRVRLAGEHTRRGLRVAVIQGSIDSEIKSDPNRADFIHRHYAELSDTAVRQHRGIDLLIWPETMFRDPIRTYTEDVCPVPDDDPDNDWTKDDLQQAIATNHLRLEELATHLNVPLLLGVDSLHYGHGTMDHYNSVVLVDRSGQVTDRYDKTHPVMFGEYVPFAKRWPWLLKLTPLGSNVEAGEGARAFDVGGVRVAPNICFESLLPHVIRGQVAQLRDRGEEPDVLANLTNDGWYWGSSELDLHLICGVFRAVECRKPMVIAANTGISAVIDATGRIQRQGPRRDTDILVEDVRRDDRQSLYVRIGDWPAGMCLALTAMLPLAGGWQWWRKRRVGMG
jgi:apolipoprotein N-acyltransferase